jgi:hypothetical protein
MGFEFGIFLGSLEHPGFANTSTVCIDDECLPRGVTHVYLRRAVQFILTFLSANGKNNLKKRTPLGLQNVNPP